MPKPKKTITYYCKLCRKTGRNRAAKPRDMSCRAAAPSSVSARQRQTALFIFITWTQTELSENEAGKMRDFWCRFSLHISLINDWSIPYHFIQALWRDCLQAGVWMERKISLMWALSALELMWHYLNVVRNHLLLWFVDIKVCSENCSNLSVILMITEKLRQTCMQYEDLIITLSAFFF